MAQAHEQRMVNETGGVRLEGEALQSYVLEKLRQGGMPEGDKELVEQLMRRLLPAGQGNVRYCVEVMTVAALRVQHSAGRQALLEHIVHFLPGEGEACQAKLGLLGGFVFGVLAQQSAPGQEWLGKLREHLQGYLEAVMEMNSEECNKLATQLTGVFTALGDGH